MHRSCGTFNEQASREFAHTEHPQEGSSPAHHKVCMAVLARITSPSIRATAGPWSYDVYLTVREKMVEKKKGVGENARNGMR